jgi:N-acetylglucosamine-6-phosphate deacetylase
MLALPHLRLVTLAPERPGALDRIRRLRAAGVVVSLGHTGAGHDAMRAAADAGATMVTHLYNAMSGLGHREPGAVGAALTDDRLTLGLSDDGVHAHPAALALAVRAAGPDRIALVTDAMAAAAMPEGRYALAGRPVEVDRSSARLADGTLAGSILTMAEAVVRMVALAGVPPELALGMASAVPARVLGLVDAGEIEVGRTADLVVLDQGLGLAATYIGGMAVYERREP